MEPSGTLAERDFPGVDVVRNSEFKVVAVSGDVELVNRRPRVPPGNPVSCGLVRGRFKDAAALRFPALNHLLTLVLLSRLTQTQQLVGIKFCPVEQRNLGPQQAAVFRRGWRRLNL